MPDKSKKELSRLGSAPLYPCSAALLIRCMIGDQCLVIVAIHILINQLGLFWGSVNSGKEVCSKERLVSRLSRTNFASGCTGTHNH